MTLLRLLCFRPAEKGDYNISEPDSSAVDMPESKLTAPAPEVTETETEMAAEVTPQPEPEPQPEAELSEPMQPSYSEHEEPPEFNYSEQDDDAGFYHNDAPPYHMEEAAKSEPVPEPTAEQTVEPTPEPAAQSSSGVADLYACESNWLKKIQTIATKH